MRIFASRQCTDYVRASYAGAGEARMARVTFCCRPIGDASCLVFVVSKPRWPRCAVVPDLHLHRQRTASSAIYLSRAYLNVSDCVTHIWPIPMVCNNIPRDIPERDPPHTYVLCENRSSIQSLALMRSATSSWGWLRSGVGSVDWSVARSGEKTSLSVQ